MREKRALQRIRDEFQKFPLGEPPKFSQRWSLMSQDRNDMLAQALLYLCDWMQIDRAAVFLLDQNRGVLIARQLVDSADVLPGEEEIALLSDSPISKVLQAKRPFLLLND